MREKIIDVLLGDGRDFGRNVFSGVTVLSALAVLALLVAEVAQDTEMGYGTALLSVLAAIAGTILAGAVLVVVLVNIGRVSRLLWKRVAEWRGREHQHNRRGGH